MYKRKLQSLGFPSSEFFSASDDKQFQNVVVWLEDQKIRRYKIENRESLRQTNKDDFEKAYNQYLMDVDCPILDAPKNETLDWLLGLAVNFDFQENYKEPNQQKDDSENSDSAVKNNTLDNLDFDSQEFKTGVSALADLLKIPKHIDHLVTLEAINNLIKEKFNQEDLKNPPKQSTDGVPIQFEELISAFDTNDKSLNYAANVLRYLFIHDLRELQTKINECIVSVQTLTANPLTDTKLGKVGY